METRSLRRYICCAPTKNF